jgi:hypothetical protein
MTAIKKNSIVLIIVACLALALAACGCSGEEAVSLVSGGAPAQGTCYVVGVGGSGGDLEMQQRNIQRFLDSLQGGDRVVADIIRDNQIASGRRSIDETLPIKGRFDQDWRYQEELEEAKASIVSGLKGMADGRYGEPSRDILTFWRWAGYELYACDEGMPRTVIIYSDGYDKAFPEPGKVTREALDAVMKQQVGDNLIPGLEGVSVEFVGPSAGEGAANGLSERDALWDFWSTYLKQASAELECYGPESLVR